jgi:hypothetical protein
MAEGEICECSPGPSVEVNYTNQGSSTGPLLVDDPPGVTVSGSSNVNMVGGNGLGVVGGFSDQMIDGSEFIEFTLDFPSRSTQYQVNGTNNLDGSVEGGDAVVEAWNEVGASLGTVFVSGTQVFDLDELFPGGARLSRFRVTADVDALTISEVVVSPVVCAGR